MKLKNGLRVLWRGAREAQVGCDPSLSVKLRLEHPREFDVLQMLEKEQTPAGLRRALERLGGNGERADRLVRELADANLLQAGSRNRSSELEVGPGRRDMVAAEGESRALVDSNGWRHLARRGDQCVSVYGLGRTGAHAAVGLAAAGVGRLQLMDQEPVRARDCGQLFARRHVGLTRAAAVAAIIAEQGLDCTAVTTGRWRRPDVAVMVDYEVSDPNRSGFLSRHGIAHLSLVVSELAIACGPWVPSGGVGPCLRCMRLWESDRDPCWPGMATQRHIRSAVAGRGEDSSLAALAGALAVGHVLEGLGGGRPFSAGRVVTVGLPSYAMNWADVDPHPECDHRPVRIRRRVMWTRPPIVPLPPAP